MDKPHCQADGENQRDWQQRCRMLCKNWKQHDKKQCRYRHEGNHRKDARHRPGREAVEPTEVVRERDLRSNSERKNRGENKPQFVT
jgi:hypothetical protein